MAKSTQNLFLTARNTSIRRIEIQSVLRKRIVGDDIGSEDSSARRDLGVAGDGDASNLTLNGPLVEVVASVGERERGASDGAEGGDAVVGGGVDDGH